jgi:hypothetical protein
MVFCTKCYEQEMQICIRIIIRYNIREARTHGEIGSSGSCDGDDRKYYGMFLLLSPHYQRSPQINPPSADLEVCGDVLNEQACFKTSTDVRFRRRVKQD